MATAPVSRTSTRTSTVEAVSPQGVDWSAVIAGALLATALSVVMIAFGSGLGLSAVSPEAGEGASLAWITVAAGLWFIWVAVSSFAAGGYLAGRMRRSTAAPRSDAAETADGVHGLVVWAVGAVIGAMLATSGVSGVAGRAASAVGSGAATVAEALGDQASYYAGRIMTDAEGGAVGDAETRERIAGIVSRSLGQDEMSASDRDYIAGLVASETGADPQEVESRLDAVLADLQAAREEAVDAIETARVTGVVAAFVVAATLLVSAVAAYAAAGYGGRHRDENVSFFRSTLR
jgi:ABC-type glycerol-3-phosphate transport system permease component